VTSGAGFASGLEVLVLVGTLSARFAETPALRAVGSEWADAGLLHSVAVREAVKPELAFHALSLPPEGLVEF
jgi:hypothetical protein